MRRERPSCSEPALSRADAVLPSDFTSVTAVRELRDGRVIVLDYGAGIVHLVDAKLTTATAIGRQGPGESRAALVQSPPR